MSRGVNCTPEQIILTSGHQRSIDIITHIFSPSDYSFAIEDPGYNGTWEIVSQSPFRIIPIPLENDGVSIDHIQRLRDTLLYVTPSHQFPMGSILPISKRLELISGRLNREVISSRMITTASSDTKADQFHPCNPSITATTLYISGHFPNPCHRIFEYHIWCFQQI